MNIQKRIKNNLFFMIANTLSEGTGPPIKQEIPAEKTAVPTVFKWDGGGKQVFITGTFSNWKALPMVKSHGDFVTIIDLPEGEHQFKFCVDGEWRHDPKMVR
jgi:5'-AMP-activated protein kinase regulatory beta subunit